MLMRRASAYSSFCSWIILVYLDPSHRNSLFCSWTLQKITKNPHFGRSRSSMLTFPNMRVASVPICNHFCVRELAWPEVCGYGSADRYLRISTSFCGYRSDTDIVFHNLADTDRMRIVLFWPVKMYDAHTVATHKWQSSNSKEYERNVLCIVFTYYLRQGGNVFAGFCLFVCLFVC